MRGACQCEVSCLHLFSEGFKHWCLWTISQLLLFTGDQDMDLFKVGSMDLWIYLR